MNPIIVHDPQPVSPRPRPAADLSLAATGPAVTSLAPFTLGAIADVPQSTAADVDRAFGRARAAQPAWAAREIRARTRVFARLHDLLLARQDQILDLIQWETGKARAHAFEEVIDAAGLCRYYVRRARAVLAPRRREGAFPLLTRVEELRHAKGVVAVITPWNYPLSLSVTDVVPALVAGNAVVHKVDTQTACTASWVRRACVEAGLPEDLWQIVTGSPEEVGPALVAGADHLGFTGSTAAGRALGRQAADRLIGCMLELGGKNPLVVLADADIGRAAAGAARAAFTSAGQLCMSAERVLVHASVHDRFADRFLAHVAAMRLSAGFDFRADMGCLTSSRQLARVTGHVEQARELGADVLCGGHRREDVGPLFYAPTVLAGTTPEMAVHTEETFGPVVSLHRFRDDDDAVTQANASPYGLTASVWSRDRAHARAVAVRLKTGAVNINEGFRAAYVSYDAPMAGRKDSGLGARHGAEGLRQYTDVQVVARQVVDVFDPFRGRSAESHAAMLTAARRAMTRLHLR